MNGDSRVQVMGILNVTPDSFSDGGRWNTTDAAISHALDMVEQGADIIDVGGESTRPGAPRVPLEQEQERVVPIVRALADRGVRVSVDTMNSDTAKATAEVGAYYINDVSGGLSDPRMYGVVAAAGIRFMIMHWREHSSTMHHTTEYGDVVTEVCDELAQRVADAVAAGVAAERIIIDPGLGFSKTGEHNWQLLARLHELIALGYPVLVGASRKRFLTEFAPAGAAPSHRDDATATISALSAQAGAWGVRVHNVAATRRALDVWERWRGATL